ncbi:MAG TPA: DUF4393 domain-containing protein, partial [Longimicrobium sp.]|nr:DUF4393 domain-containing protein [Longimicrobium sp.]
LISPSPMLLNGVIRGVQATGPETDPNLREMYASLLSTAIDSATSSIAHPAFAEILGQMLPDEAKIIRLLKKREGRALVSLGVSSWKKEYVVVGDTERFSQRIIALGREAECANPESLQIYIDNLKRLGLVTGGEHTFSEHSKQFPPEPPSAETIEVKGWLFGYDYPEVSDLLAKYSEFRAPNPRSTTSEIQVEVLQLTSFGTQFVQACAGD